MPSQPDFTRAYQLSPHLKPEDSAELLAKEREKNAQLTEELAKLKGVSVEEVAKELEQEALPPAESPLPAPAPSATDAVVEVTSEEAQFFASKEGRKYFPIDQLAKSSVKPENLRFFLTEEDALAASYSK